MPLVDAWDLETGERLPILVPKHHIGHKILGPHLTAEPPAREPVKPKPATKATDKKEESSNGSHAR